MEQPTSQYRQKFATLVARAKSLSLATIVAFASVVSIMPMQNVSAQNLTAAPRVSFTFDDGLASTLTQAAPTLDAFGYDGTVYVATGCVGTVGTCPAEESHTYMTWDQVAQLAAFGWEIGSHTVTHPLLASTDPEIQTTDLTDEQVIAELRDSKQALNDHGYPALSFAEPYGDYDAFSRSEAAKLYTSARGYKDVNTNQFPYNDFYLQVKIVESNTTVAQVKTYIDDAKTNNYWLVLVFHDVLPQATLTSAPDEYATPTEDLQAIAQYVKDQELQVTTVTGGLVSGANNLLPNGDFETVTTLGAYAGTPSATEWTTNDQTNIVIDTNTNGNFPNPTTSIAITSGTTNNNLFSPLVAVDPTQSYVLKSYLYVETITSGELGYYIHEYDAAGIEIGGTWKKAETTVFVDSINLTYTPTSATVAEACLEVYTIANSGIKAYVDNFQWFMVAPDKLGDLNGDGQVNLNDLSIMSNNWGAQPATPAQGDLNGDGTVSINDLSILSSNWGK